MRRLLLALLLAMPALARAQTRGVAPLYPPASGAWTAAIGGALAQPVPGQALTPLLTALSAPGLVPAATFAPVAFHLKVTLGIAPAAFAALPASEQHAALDLAAEQAQGELQQKAVELDALSRSLASPGRALDKDGRAQLYGVVARLQEMRASYAPLLSETARAAVDSSYERSVLRALQIRDALTGRRAEELGAGLDAGERDAGPSVALRADPTAIPGTSARSLQLYEQMSASTAGWGADDVDALLTGYGFIRRDGKHRNYSHPDFPQLHDSYSHQRVLKDIYIKSALRMVRELARLRASAAAPAAKVSAAPDVSRVTLADLSVLIAAEKPAAKPKAAPVAAPAPALVASARPAAREATSRRSPAALAPATPAPAPRKAEPPAPPLEPALEPALPEAEAAPSAPAPDSSRPRASSWFRSILGLDR